MTIFPRRWTWLNDEPGDRTYVVDTSSWIALFRGRPKKLNENIRARVDALIRRGLVVSPRLVYDELSARNDELLSWISDRQEIFRDADTSMLELVVKINSKHPLLTRQNKAMPSADPHIIALAVILDRRGLSPPPVVVTEESNRPDRIAKIPYVADDYGVMCTNLDGMLRREVFGARPRVY